MWSPVGPRKYLPSRGLRLDERATGDGSGAAGRLLHFVGQDQEGVGSGQSGLQQVVLFGRAGLLESPLSHTDDGAGRGTNLVSRLAQELDALLAAAVSGRLLWRPFADGGFALRFLQFSEA